MNRVEIDKYLSVSRGHSIMVDVAPISEINGLLRTVLIHPENRVTVEFMPCTIFRDEPNEHGLLKYVGRYNSLEVALTDLEVYLDLPMVKWTNYSRIAYDFKDCKEPDFEVMNQNLEKAVLSGTIRAPSKGHWQLADHYWKHIKAFGKFRPEMLGKESEFYFHE